MIKRVISELVPSAPALLAFFEFVFPKVAERAFDHVLNRRIAEFKSILDTSLEAYKDEPARASSAHRLNFDQEMRFFDKNGQFAGGANSCLSKRCGMQYWVLTLANWRRAVSFATLRLFPNLRIPCSCTNRGCVCHQWKLAQFALIAML